MPNYLHATTESRHLVHISTKHPDGTAFDCVVLERKKHFIIAQEIRSFEPDGVIVIPRQWIQGIRNGRREKRLNDVLSHVIDVNNLPSNLPYFGHSGVPDILKALQAEGVWPAIEVIYRSSVSLYLGPITEVSQSVVKIYCYDSMGQWEKEYEVDYGEIFKIEIDSSYTKHFNDYMRLKALPRKLAHN